MILIEKWLQNDNLREINNWFHYTIRVPWKRFRTSIVSYIYPAGDNWNTLRIYLSSRCHLQRSHMNYSQPTPKLCYTTCFCFKDVCAQNVLTYRLFLNLPRRKVMIDFCQKGKKKRESPCSFSRSSSAFLEDCV